MSRSVVRCPACGAVMGTRADNRFEAGAGGVICWTKSLALIGVRCVACNARWLFDPAQKGWTRWPH